MTLRISTKHPIAVDSIDHQFPSGTMRDNSQNLAFNRKVWDLGIPVRVLDLGCSGGAMVRTFLEQGGFAVGVEGSDYSRNLKRAEWGTIPEHLFTADITKPFRLLNGNRPVTFTVITAWEFFEHIPEDRLDGVFANIDRHLAPEGLLVVSIATCADVWEGHVYHATVQPHTWWEGRLNAAGYSRDVGLTEHFDPDWVRGPVTGNHSSLCAVFRR